MCNAGGKEMKWKWEDSCVCETWLWREGRGTATKAMKND